MISRRFCDGSSVRIQESQLDTHFRLLDRWVLARDRVRPFLAVPTATAAATSLPRGTTEVYERRNTSGRGLVGAV